MPLDGRVIKFRRAFKPLAGFDNVSFLGEALQAGGRDQAGPDWCAQCHCGIAPSSYATLSSETPNVYLADAAPRAFCLAPMLGDSGQQLRLRHDLHASLGKDESSLDSGDSHFRPGSRQRSGPESFGTPVTSFFRFGLLFPRQASQKSG